MESLEQKHISMIAEAQRRGRGDAGGIRLCFEVLALASAIDRSCALRLAPHRLSEGKFVLLCLLHDRSEGLAPHELATRAGVTRATVTGLLDGLERDGYVARQAHREDRRKILVTLTPSGQVLADALFDEHSQWIASLFNGFEPQDRKTLSDLLARVRHNLAEGEHTDMPSAEGAQMRVADIPPERLNLLNTGQAESTTLTECLAVDFAALMRATFPDFGQERLSAMQAASGAGITSRMALAAKLIHDAYPQGMVTALCQHKSDTLRGWACYLIATQEDMPLRTRLMSMRCLADDAHFGVREWAWLAVRPYIAADLDDAISELSVWALDPSERIRRFASEAIRPRGVWCAHLTPLRQRPEQALPVLEPLRADPVAYVQDSVGNWLNDASKDQPGWVQSLCDRWQQENGNPATARICKRALRSIEKKKQT